MSACYGRLKGLAGMATRRGHDDIWASLETWLGSVRVRVFKDGSFVIHIGPKHGLGSDAVGGTISFEGNVGDNGRNCYKYGRGGRRVPVQVIKRSRRVEA